jgi:hypothetical protein
MVFYVFREQALNRIVASITQIQSALNFLVNQISLLEDSTEKYLPKLSVSNPTFYVLSSNSYLSCGPASNYSRLHTYVTVQTDGVSPLETVDP